MSSLAITQAPSPPPRVYWATQIIGWLIYSAPQVYAAVAYLHISAIRASLESFGLGAAALLLTHVLRFFARRRHWEQLRWLALTPRVILGSLIVGTPLGIAENFMAIAALRQPDATLPNAPHFDAAATLLLHISNWASLILIWYALYFAALTVRQRRWAEQRQLQLSKELNVAQLRLLKSQLNPHFLFNSLNSVRALIADDAPRAQKAVTQLARTLRYTLTSEQEELVTLREEITIVEDYLGLEALRLGERLQLDWQVEPETLDVRIPVMLLQTIIENAIKHGIAELPAGGVLRVAAVMQDETLLLEVENPRPSKAPLMKPEGEGVGLKNSAERLRLLFGERATLNLDLSDAARAVTRVRIPLR